MRIGLIGIDGSHADDFVRLFNVENRFRDSSVTAFWSHEGDPARIGEITNIDASLNATSSLRALLDAVDAVVVGCRHGALHKDHALAAIGAGRPLFIDKPLALSSADAVAILDAAERANVPLFSGSALRWQHDTMTLKARLAYLEPPVTIEANGTWYPDNEYGGAPYYAVHTVELVQEVLGTDWRNLQRLNASAVACEIGGVPVTLRFASVTPEGSHFAIAATGRLNTFTQRVALPDDYMAPVAHRLVEMLRTGKSPMTREQLLAPVLMMEALVAALA